MKYFDTDGDYDDRLRERIERQQETVVCLTDEEIAARIAEIKAMPLPSTRRKRRA